MAGMGFVGTASTLLTVHNDAEKESGVQLRDSSLTCVNAVAFRDHAMALLQAERNCVLVYKSSCVDMGTPFRMAEISISRWAESAELMGRYPALWKLFLLLLDGGETTVTLLAELLGRSLKPMKSDGHKYFSMGLRKFEEEMRQHLVARGQERQIAREPCRSDLLPLRQTCHLRGCILRMDVYPFHLHLRRSGDRPDRHSHRTTLLVQIEVKVDLAAKSSTTPRDFLVPLADKIQVFNQSPSFSLSFDPLFQPLLRILASIYAWFVHIYIGPGPANSSSLALPTIRCSSCRGCQHLNEFLPSPTQQTLQLSANANVRSHVEQQTRALQGCTFETIKFKSPHTLVISKPLQERVRMSNWAARRQPFIAYAQKLNEAYLLHTLKLAAHASHYGIIVRTGQH